MQKTKKIYLSVSFTMVILALTGCGSNSEQQVKALCEEANVALAEMVSGNLPDSLNLAQVEIGMLIERAEDLGENQLARDFSSVSADIFDVYSAYSLVETYGESEETVQRYNDAANKFEENGALNVAGQRITFVGCD